MSQQELDRADQEVMDMVNAGATPQAEASAEQIEARVREIEAEQEQKLMDAEAKKIRDAEEEKARQEAMFAALKRSEEQYLHRKKIRDTMIMVLSVVACAGISALLIVPMYVLGFAVWTANVGVLTSGVVAGVCVARWLQQRKRWW